MLLHEAWLYQKKTKTTKKKTVCAACHRADDERFARDAVGTIGGSLHSLREDIGAQRDDVASVLADIKQQLQSEEARLEAEAEAEWIAARRRDMGI
eukprot:SAG31_NODE_7205_length_1755_cov_2.266304_3_plen_95_part_01